MTDYNPLLAFGTPGWQELLILAVIGILIFGKRLPEVGRSIGRGIVEFKKGLAGVDEEVEQAAAAQRKHELEAKAGGSTKVETETTESTKTEGTEASA